MVGAQPVAVLCRRSGQRMSRKGEHIVSAAALGATGIHALGVDLHAHILSLLYRTGQIVGPGLPKYIAHQQDSSETGVRAGGIWKVAWNAQVAHETAVIHSACDSIDAPLCLGGEYKIHRRRRYAVIVEAVASCRKQKNNQA